MKFKYIAILLLSLGTVVNAQGEDSTFAEMSDEMVNEFIETKNALRIARYEKYKVEKDPAKAKVMRDESRALSRKVNDKVLRLVREKPERLISVKLVDWAFMALKTEEQRELVDYMMKHHKDNKDIVRVLRMAAYRGVISLNELRRSMMVSNDEEMRQNLMAILAHFAETKEKDIKKSLALYEQVATWPNIEKVNPRLYATSEGIVYRSKYLVVGKKARDIVGLDEQGKEFKLSDYRGKVVMLNFWGSW